MCSQWSEIRNAFIAVDKEGSATLDFNEFKVMVCNGNMLYALHHSLRPSIAVIAVQCCYKNPVPVYRVLVRNNALCDCGCSYATCVARQSVMKDVAFPRSVQLLLPISV